MCKLDKLVETMNQAIEHNKGFEIEVIAPYCEEPELIRNPSSNVKMKRDYYSSAYNDDLQLKNNTNVKIVDFRIVD